MAINEYLKSDNLEVRQGWGTTYPTSGTWNVGDIIFNTVPAAAGVVGWVCTTAGATGGTWKPFGLIGGPYTIDALVATAGTITTGVITGLSSTNGTIATGTVTGLTSTNATITTDNVTNLIATNGTISSGVIGCPVVTLTSASALTIKKGLQLISLSAGDTMTLAQAASHAAGFAMTIVNLANNSVTLATVAGAAYEAAAAITLAQHAAVRIIGDGVLWYKGA